MTKIKYKPKHLKINLLFGIFWLILWALKTFTTEKQSWINWGFLSVAILYLATYFYFKRFQYLTIKDRKIKVNQPFGKQIILDEITEIKKFSGDLILKTSNKELTIHTRIVDPASLKILEETLEKLKLG